MNEFNRREFLKFMGCSATAVLASSCVSRTPLLPPAPVRPALPFLPLTPNREDILKLADGFRYDVVLKWRQILNAKGERFGFNNDYIAYLPFTANNPLEGWMWVNHEYHDPFYNSDWRPGQARTLEQVKRERKEVGGSICHVRFLDEKWQLVENSKHNRRLDAFTEIPIISDRPILGRKTAIGTFANCAGGVTPWGTVLTCEENYDNFVGEAVYSDTGRKIVEGDTYLSWAKNIKLPPEHYGWVVEVDVKTGQAKKLTALGRFAHECATTTLAPDGRAVVYSGDDHENEHVYKFISRKPGSLEQGELFVADTVNGRWLPLSRAKDVRLRKAFSDHTEMMIRAREAAKIVGATPLDRPEDIEIHPQTRDVFISLTGIKSSTAPFGSILKIVEKDANPLSLEFSASTFKAGGTGSGFANPDNLAFDVKGNLWMTTDMSGTSMHKDQFEPFGNNGLFYIPLSGAEAGRAFQVASAPPGAELTGPCFAPDGRTLFLSVQHPGERAHLRPQITSHWPDGGDAAPAPSVVAISGPALTALIDP